MSGSYVRTLAVILVSDFFLHSFCIYVFNPGITHVFLIIETVLIYDIKTQNWVSTGPADEPVEEANTILWCAVSSKRHSPFDNNLALACGRTVAPNEVRELNVSKLACVNP